MRILDNIVEKLFTDPITGSRIQNKVNLVKLGSKYGGWVVPKNHLSNKSVCYLVGAGEDISFDCEIAKRYKSDVYIIDPTERARQHFKNLEENALGAKVNKNIYGIDKDSFSRLKYLPCGVARKTEIRKFYEPKNPDHVSCSIVNLQNTKKYFKAKCFKLSDLIKKRGHKKIDLLKIDIEGAEYEVVDSIVEDGVVIDVICVEYDELHNSMNKGYKKRIKKSVSSLIKNDYQLVSVDSLSNYTFVKNSLDTEKLGVLGMISVTFRQGKNLLLVLNNQIKERSTQ